MADFEKSTTESPNPDTSHPEDESFIVGSILPESMPSNNRRYTSDQPYATGMGVSPPTAWQLEAQAAARKAFDSINE